MPKGTPKFNDVATEVIDALTSAGWDHTGVTHAGFWTVTQMGRGPELVDVFTPAGQRQDRVWLSPAKGGKRAEKRALAALEGAGFKAAERRQKGLRIVRARARRNAPRRARHNFRGSRHRELARDYAEASDALELAYVINPKGPQAAADLEASDYYRGLADAHGDASGSWPIARDEARRRLEKARAASAREVREGRKRHRGSRNAPRKARARRNPNRHALVDLVSYLAIQARGEGFILGLPDLDLEDTPAPWVDAKAWRGYVAREWSEEFGDPMASSVALVQSGSWSPYPATVPRSEWEPSGPLEELYTEIVDIPFRLDRGAGASGEEGRRMWKAAVSKAKAAPWRGSSRNAPKQIGLGIPLSAKGSRRAHRSELEGLPEVTFREINPEARTHRGMAGLWAMEAPGTEGGTVQHYDRDTPGRGAGRAGWGYSWHGEHGPQGRGYPTSWRAMLGARRALAGKQPRRWTLYGSGWIDDPWNDDEKMHPWGATENPPLLPLTSSRRKWDAAKARRALKKWATTKGGRVDMRKYARAFLIVDGDPANLSSYKLPIATVVKDKRGARRLKAVPHAIYAAAGVIDGARGGVDASPRAQERAREALTRYYKKMKKAPPWGTRNPPRLRGARRNPGPTLSAASRRAPPALRRK